MGRSWNADSGYTAVRWASYRLTPERWKGLPVESPVRRCSRLRRSLCSLAHSCAATADSTVALRTIWPSWRTETRLRAPVISSSHSKPDTRHRRITEVPIAPPEVRSRQNPTPLRSFGLSVNVLPSTSSGAAHTTPRRTALFATTGGRDPCVSCHRDHLGDDPRSAAPSAAGDRSDRVSITLNLECGGSYFFFTVRAKVRASIL